MRAGQHRTNEGEHSEPIFATSSYVFKNAAEAAACGAAARQHLLAFHQSRCAFEESAWALEGGERCVAFASGMVAILSTCLALLKSGDHIVSSRSIFGATVLLFNNYLGKFGVETTTCRSRTTPPGKGPSGRTRSCCSWKRRRTPFMEIADIARLAKLAHAKGCLLVVDNVFCTPVQQRAFKARCRHRGALGDEIHRRSGRCVGGAVVGTEAVVGKEVYGFLRTCGPSLSPFNAWVFLKGLETLALRMKAHSESAGARAMAGKSSPR